MAQLSDAKETNVKGAHPTAGTVRGPQFKALFITQFLGAMNDNLSKIVLSLLILEVVTDKSQSALYLSIVHAVFVLPFIVFSSYAGFCSDRFRKSTIIRSAKWWELAVAMLMAIYFIDRNIPVLIALLFVMGMQSAFFSPAKFGVLPEILSDRELSKGNGYIEFGTFVSIIIGTALGGFLKSIGGTDLSYAAMAVVGSSVLGLFSSYFMAPTPVANPDKKFDPNILRDVWDSLKAIRTDRPLFLTLLAISYFWFLAALFQPTILLYARDLLLATEAQSSILLAILAVGTGLGSILAGKVSEGKVELGLVPIGSLGLSIFCAALYFTDSSMVLTAAVLFLLGASCGYYLVPLNSFIQHASPDAERGRYLGTLNVVAFSAMFLSAGVFSFLTNERTLDLQPSSVFLVVGILTIFVGAWIVYELPQMMIRCINWMFSRMVYSLKVVGADNIPKEGGALLVSNHVSFVDPSLILASIERPVRFIMYKPIYDLPLVNTVARIMGAIPVNPAGSPKTLLRALGEAREAIKNGELVCIFAEGAITRIGRMIPFSRGLERIMDGLNAPIIPVHLDELWGSIFSYKGGTFFFKMPREIPYPATLFYGAPLPAVSKAHEVRQSIGELSAQSYQYRNRRHQLLTRAFLTQAKRTPFRVSVSDSTGKKLRYIQLLTVSTLFAQKLRKRIVSKEKVGIFLPASVGGDIANIGTLFAGAVPVNLNFTASPGAMASAASQCEMRYVISSRTFEKKLGVTPPGEAIYIEELLGGLTKRDLVLSAAMNLLLPRWALERLLKVVSGQPEDLATVMFSSGSTGEPKGVMLSHANISSNIDSIYELFRLSKDDCLVGVLPFFHSFGFTATMWMPLLGGFRGAYHPNPVDAATIGELARTHQATILMATPTFLQTYIRKIPKESFAHLRLVVVGAEKLREKLAESFQEKFGLMPLEGYGCTELSPVALVNIPDHESRGIRQEGAKLGTVGAPIPGVAVRIVDPESYQLRKPDEEGLMLISGPNVMLGYLGNEKKTKEVIRDGWYITGDIAVMDGDGFITIRDRLSRFSKIGGEMVPHIGVEDEIHSILDIHEQVVVVTSVSDAKKGERLIVLYKVECNPAEIVKALQGRDLPNLWIPKREDFHRVEEFPLLGTGKLDLQGIKKLAERLQSTASDREADSVR